MYLPANKHLKWLYLDINSYFASVEQQDKPELRNKPVIVVPSIVDSTCAIAVSYEAKKYGIKTGTRVYEAKKMCKDLIMVKAQHKLYLDYHHRILRTIEKLIPIEHKLSIDEVACILGKSYQNKDRAIALANDIKLIIQKEVGEYIKCSIGISINRYLSKIASNLKKPDGLTILSKPEDLLLYPNMPVGDLVGIGKNTQSKLNKCGIFTVENLFKKSKGEMRAIWKSVEGERFWYKLHGYDIADPIGGSKSIGHSKVLAPEERNNPKRVLNILLSNAVSRCRSQNYLTRLITISLSLDSGKKIKHSKKTPNINDELTLRNIVSNMWQEIGSPAKAIKVSVSLDNLIKTDKVTGDLFVHSGKKDKPEALSKALDLIKSKYNNNNLIKLGADSLEQKKEEAKIAFARIPEADEYF